ncbi:hypothetical protein BS78_K110000 [Paspalum vaginatum]|uniref:Uncharacterized protein n=1 Tax=Paspalum vaginatum TaxID=158149 RepID=A0A9W8CDW4_9POAL|nr:hypothetical protein BS78_K110000 [Paspalum vaginatum]
MRMKSSTDLGVILFFCHLSFSIGEEADLIVILKQKSTLRLQMTLAHVCLLVLYCSGAGPSECSPIDHRTNVDLEMFFLRMILHMCSTSLEVSIERSTETGAS